MDLKIEKNIPIPKTNGNYREAIQKMQIGDSILCPTESLANSLRIGMKRVGFGAMSRQVENGYRIWRIK